MQYLALRSLSSMHWLFIVYIYKVLIRFYVLNLFNTPMIGCMHGLAKKKTNLGLVFVFI